MTEGTLKAELVDRMRKKHPRWVIFRHEDRNTSGVPDISINGEQRTVWVEVKFADPDFETHGIQDLEMLRLASQGYAALYLIYEEMGNWHGTRLLHPKDYANWQDKGILVEGIDHDWVIEKIEKLIYGNETETLNRRDRQPLQKG